MSDNEATGTNAIRSISAGRRSKFHSQPGSVHTKQLDYESKSHAFLPVNSERVKSAKAEVAKLKDRNRLGKKKEWNTSTQTIPFSKDRSKMRALSEFQSEKIEYDFRAATVPQVYRNVIYVPRKNKFQVDEEKFIMSELQLSHTSTHQHAPKLVANRNIVARLENSKLKAEEHERTLAGKPDWNKTTEVDFKLKEQVAESLRLHSTLNTKKVLMKTMEANGKQNGDQPGASSSSSSSPSPLHTSLTEREALRNQKNRARKKEERSRVEQEKLKKSEEPQVLRLGLREKMISTMMNRATVATVRQDEDESNEEFVE